MNNFRINNCDIDENTNLISLLGTLESAPTYSHNFDDTDYYSVKLRVNRFIKPKSDLLHVFLPESMLFIANTVLDIGIRIELEGYLVQSELKNMSDVSVVATTIQLVKDAAIDRNILYLGGKILKSFDLKSITNSSKLVKPLIVRNTTFLSADKSRNLNLKVSCWNNNAKLVESKYAIGDIILVRGQLESKLLKSKDDETTLVNLHEASAVMILDIPNSLLSK